VTFKKLFIVTENCVLLLFLEKWYVVITISKSFSGHFVPITASGPQG